MPSPRVPPVRRLWPRSPSLALALLPTVDAPPVPTEQLPLVRAQPVDALQSQSEREFWQLAVRMAALDGVPLSAKRAFAQQLTRAGDQQHHGPSLLVQGDSLRTWSAGRSPLVEQTQIVRATEARPLVADIGLRSGFHDTPCSSPESDPRPKRPRSEGEAKPDLIGPHGTPYWLQCSCMAHYTKCRCKCPFYAPETSDEESSDEE